jgi:hypothetical protein
LTVTAVNDPPTLNAPPNVALTENPPNHTVSLTGIAAGGNESQTLSVRVTSSNPALIPSPSTVTYTSPSPTGSFSLNPANAGTGSAEITVTVWDNGNPSNSVSRTFTVYVRSSTNTRPSLNGLTSRSTTEDTPITFPFQVNDTVTPAGNLVVGAQASNLDLVPPDAITIVGATTDRSMTITPATDRFGTTTITVWVLDGQFGYTASNFVFQVMSVNDRPTISSIADQAVEPGQNMAPVPFSVRDAETPAQSLSVTALSSNPTLLPSANVVLGGSGTNRSVMAYPVAGQTGSATLTITVTDSTALATNTTFVLNVRPLQPPVLTIRRSGTNVELLWPIEAGIYTLQGRDQLNAGAWSDILATPSTVGTNYVVIQPLTGLQKFFRLRN